MTEIPIPASLLEVIWLGMGLNFGRAFGKQLDQEIQASEWLKRRSKFWQALVRRLLDATHHWWMGGLLMVYFGASPEVFWFGVGLFIDDLPDVPRRISKLIRVKV